jgi:hypothetical protein
MEGIEETHQENHTTITVDTCKEALTELYKQVLFAEYKEGAIRNLLGGEITYKNVTTLIRKWGINGRSSLNGERHTLVFDIDGVFNGNHLYEIFLLQRVEQHALDLLSELNELLPEANIIFFTSRPFVWNILPWQSWQRRISEASGNPSIIPLVPSNLETIENTLQGTQPLRIMFTDAGKNMPERFIMPFFGRRQWFRDLVINDKDAFFPQALEIMQANLCNFTFIDSGDYSKDDVKDVIPDSIYIGIKSNAKWDKIVLASNRMIQVRDTLTRLTGIILQSHP